MIKFEPPYFVRMIESGHDDAAAEAGVVYSSGNPDDAQAFALGLRDTGASIVEVRDSTGRLVRRFADPPPWRC
jgi:hypothetical protein